jgi:hypothetical protein
MLTIFAPKNCAEKVRKVFVANFHQQVTCIPCNDIVLVSET